MTTRDHRMLPFTLWNESDVSRFDPERAPSKSLGASIAPPRFWRGPSDRTHLGTSSPPTSNTIIEDSSSLAKMTISSV